MITSDVLNIFIWWLVFFATGLFFFPITSLIFNNFCDKGYIFAKISGIGVISYLIWVLANFHLLAFSSLNIFLISILFLVINSFLAFKKAIILEDLSKLKLFVLEEIIFAAGLFFWSIIRGFEPSIHGLEKFMDFGFVNSILRSTYFPPKDLWMSPLSINYYYFGHLVTAVLVKISNIPVEIGFNLMIATLFALTLAGSFSIGANLYYLFSKKDIATKLAHPELRTILAGSLSAFLVTLGGNLHTIYVFFQTYTPADKPVPFWQLPIMFNPSGYWYPNATRFIPFTIHEFPIYSFVVSDLHGHVLDLPFVLLTIALLIKIYVEKELKISSFILLSFLVAIMLMTNVLDGPIYLLLLFLILLFKLSHEFKLPKAIWRSIGISAAVTVGGVIFSLPFWLSFIPFGAGIGVLCAPSFLTNIGHVGPLLFEANHCMRSPVWMMAILWGFFYFVALGFLYFIVRKRLKALLENTPLDSLIVIFIIFASILIIIPELVYIKDIYPQYYRANTLFKFGYQAFIVLALSAGYMIVRLLSQKNVRLVYLCLGWLLFTLVAIYPYFAINSYYGNLKKYQGLNGLNYLSGLYPTDYQAILWLRSHIKGQPIILEAQGDSYTDYARVSANTGLPTVIGWPVHEWLWRGSYTEAGLRSQDVTTLYESQDLNQTSQLLKKYHVSYVFAGSLERQKYSNLDEAKFSQLGKVIYKNGLTTIYQIN